MLNIASTITLIESGQNGCLKLIEEALKRLDEECINEVSPEYSIQRYLELTQRLLSKGN